VSQTNSSRLARSISLTHLALDYYRFVVDEELHKAGQHNDKEANQTPNHAEEGEHEPRENGEIILRLLLDLLAGG